jgi:hypothetical protein
MNQQVMARIGKIDSDGLREAFARAAALLFARPAHPQYRRRRSRLGRRRESRERLHADAKAFYRGTAQDTTGTAQ